LTADITIKPSSSERTGSAGDRRLPNRISSNEISSKNQVLQDMIR
jgi:hypothetical protein